MAIRPNRAYNDPALGQAFTNIAQMFAPPSGGDLAGFATARAKGEEADRLSSLYSYAQGPNFDQTTFDRMGQASGQWNPGNGYYGVNVGASTSMSNNAADNARALEVARMGEAGALARQYAQPVIVNEGQVAHMPVQTSAATGLGDQLFGNIAAAQGETITTPDGRTIAGQAKPLSETEMLGAILGDLPASEQRARSLQGVGTVAVRGPKGNELVFEPDAVGRTPVADPTKAPKAETYITATGTRGTTHDGGLTDAHSGERLPQGTRVHSTSVQGSALDAGVGPTTANTTEANKTEAVLNAMDADIGAMEALLRNNPGVAGTPGAIRGIAQNLGTSIGEVLTSFGGDLNPNAAVTLEDVQAATRTLAPNRDPAIAQFNIGLSNMAYRLAQMNNPGGEVSRQAFERAMESLSGGMFSNNASTLEALGAMREQVARNRQNFLGTMRAPGQEVAPAAPAQGPQPGHVEEGYRFKGGNAADPSNWEPI